MSALPHVLKVKLTAAENESRGGKKEKAILSGVEALNHKWGNIKGKDAKSLQLPALEELTTYSWLLSEADQTILTDMVTRKHEQLSVVKVGDKRPAKTSEIKAGKKSKTSGEDARKSATALFQ
eukprot:6478320-Amphidinium_carterae.3